MTFRKQQGLGMIEVLVTVLVLAIGLLGLAGLQAASLRNNQSAYMRTQAVILAYDMLDRMRVNSQGILDGEYDNLDTTSLPTNPGCITSATGCTPDQIADVDLINWSNELDTSLPSGEGSVTRDANNNFVITVMWDDDRSGATGTGCDPTDPNDMKCFSVNSQVMW